MTTITTSVEHPVPAQDLSPLVGHRLIYTYANGWQYPFWDQPRLTRIVDFLGEPTASEAQALHRSGVRWVLVVPGHDEVSPAMAIVAERVFAERGVEVYRLDARSPLTPARSDRTAQAPSS